MPEDMKRIRELNDNFRSTLLGGELFITRGINALGKEWVKKILEAVVNFKDFSEENDPYGEHNFGNLTVDNQKIFWKIDYYDKAVKFGSEDPSNPEITTRVLTVMLPSEY